MEFRILSFRATCSLDFDPVYHLSPPQKISFIIKENRIISVTQVLRQQNVIEGKNRVSLFPILTHLL